MSEIPSDLQAVLDRVVDGAARLCGADDAIIRLIEGDQLVNAAHAGPLPLARQEPFTLDRDSSFSGRALLDRSVVQVEDLQAVRSGATGPGARDSGARTVLWAPLLVADEAIGVLIIRRCERQTFTADQVHLVRSFAEMAALAIENARLKGEAETHNAQLGEALEQQTATAEVLNIIVSSPTELQPVLDAICESAARVCGATDSNIRLADGDELVLAASFGRLRPGNIRIPIVGTGHSPEAFAGRRPVQIADAWAEAPQLAESARRAARAGGYRAVLTAPLLREGQPIGVLQIRRAEPGHFGDKQVQQLETFAAQAVIAIENARLFKDLREALDHQTATSEVLNIIASSPTELQPVLNAIAENAASVCGATDADIRLREGDALVRVAEHGQLHSPQARVALDPTSRGGANEAFRDCRPIQVADIEAEDADIPPGLRDAARLGGYRASLSVPLSRENEAIGIIQIRRPDPGSFSPKQVQLLEAFAAQAVIAIENVRLFTELRESLEQQTAMSEVLEIIASSPTDVQPVLDAICQSAARVVGVDDADIRLVEDDELVIAARFGPHQPGLRRIVHSGPVISPRAWRERRAVQSEDVLADDAHVSENTREAARVGGYRALLAVPLLREDSVVGVIDVRRVAPGLFTDRQIALLEAFAAQAVIAIENVRLFHELEERNAALREALDHQTATAEVLGIISRSPTDVQPVLDAICESAARVCGIDDILLLLAEGDVAVSRSHFGSLPPDNTPVSIEPGGAAYRAIHLGETVHYTDILVEGSEQGRRLGREEHYRSGLITPLRGEEGGIGFIAARRTEVRPFTPAQIKLLETFAAQAVIAVENVRLFDELQQKTREQAETLEEQAATNHILEIISQSPTDVQPVLDAIVESAARVCAVTDANIRLLQGDDLVTAATYGGLQSGADRIALHSAHGPGVAAVLERRVVQVDDLFDDESSSPSTREDARAGGYRAMLCAPLGRDGEPIGVIQIRRAARGRFSDRQVKLLETFADQAVIAIENVRLFHELEERNAALREALEHQTATAEVLGIISRSPTELQPVLEAICASAARVCETADAVIYLAEGDEARPVAAVGTLPIPVQPVAIKPGGGAWRTVREGQTVQFHDMLAEGSEVGRRMAQENLARSVVMAPLRTEAGGIGYIVLRRGEVRPFSDAQIKLLETFADQAVIAIENVRLFEELQQKTREQAETLEEQAATNHILEVISQSPTDVQPVLDTIAESAARLCEASDANVRLVEDGVLRLRAYHGETPNRETSLPIELTNVPGRALLERDTIRVVTSPAATAERDFVVDAQGRGEVPVSTEAWAGPRSIAATPLLREGNAIGTLLVRRNDEEHFSDRQAVLLESFARQAVIAIENVRLFHELEERNAALREALEHQTATAEVLSIISRSPTDVQPVLDAIVDSAARVCGVEDVLLRIVEGDVAVLRASTRTNPRTPAIGSPWPLDGPEVVYLIERGTLHIADIHNQDEFPRMQSLSQEVRTWLGVALRHKGQFIGWIRTARPEVRPFTAAQIKLFETFADQAVIAIENVRLFEELQQRNADLTESLAQQTATAEVLEVMSAAPEQLQLVLDAVAERAVQVCNANDATIYIAQEGLLRHAARWGHGMAAVDEIPVDTSRMSGHAFTEQRVVHVPDALQQTQYAAIRDAAEAGGAHAYLAVPLVHEARPLGVIVARRLKPDAFTERQIELLKTFADQAAIAIAISGLIEEIRETNRQLAVASQHKSQFLANMSHELRTPLNAILGYTELITDAVYGDVPEKIQEVLDRVDANGRHLLGLINDVLDLSKMEAGQLVLALDDYSLDDLIQTVATQVEPLAGEKQLALEIAVEGGLPVGRGDNRRIAQVLLNLLGNAIKFTDAGEVAIHASVIPSPAAPGEGGGEGTQSFVVAVSDTGRGISEADQARIFDEFQQGDGSTTRPRGGTGLGLSIAKRIVDMHGGRIWVDSVEGQGATFTFTIPVRVEKQVMVE